MPYADGYARRRNPDRAAHPGGYEAGYAGDPHAGGGYTPYPSQG
jgi:hypothetical protein